MLMFIACCFGGLNPASKFLASTMSEFTIVAQLMDAGGQPEEAKQIIIKTREAQ